MSKPNTQPQTAAYFNLTVLAVFFHAFMEWLFFVTQSSSLSTLSWLEKLKVLFVTGGALSVPVLILLLIFIVPAHTWKILGYLPAALMLTISALLLLDNFTYTVAKFGVVSTTGAWRILYIIGLVVIFYGALGFIRRQKLWKGASVLTFSLLAVSAGAILSIYLSRDSALDGYAPTTFTKRPNIIIIGGDGLSARYLSAYGYEENTTPFLAELM